MTVLSNEDEGKFLMDVRGEQIGIVTEVDAREQKAYVDPEPGIAAALESLVKSVNVTDKSEDDIEILANDVATITDTELRVNADLSSES
jgi:hypothetical protein